MVSATITLSADTQLKILAGNAGVFGTHGAFSGNPGGGGGGSYVGMISGDTTVPLIVAGAGGGAGDGASSTTSGLEGQGLGANNAASGWHYRQWQ